MTTSISEPDIERLPRATRYITKIGDPVWCKIGVGWCAGHLIGYRRRDGIDRPYLKFLTGAREVREWHELRFRDGEDK
jgi:hypothetical protein